LPANIRSAEYQFTEDSQSLLGGRVFRPSGWIFEKLTVIQGHQVVSRATHSRFSQEFADMIWNQKALIVVKLLIFLLFLPSQALACLYCRVNASGVNPVTTGIFNESFWIRVAAVLAPFPVFGAIVAFIYFTPQDFRKNSDE
jgi:hypothetical protein